MITGTGSGIGRAIGVELARLRGRIVCADVDPVRAKESAHLIVQAGREALALACDVTDEKQSGCW